MPWHMKRRGIAADRRMHLRPAARGERREARAGSASGGIFNRSYYEEALIARVHPEILLGEGIPDVPHDDKAVWAIGIVRSWILRNTFTPTAPA